MPRKPFVVAGLAVGSAALLAMLEATQTWARMRSFGQPFDWFRGFGRTFMVWIAVVAISGPAFAFARRYRLDRARRVPLHLLAALIFALIASFVSGAITALQNPNLAFFFVVGKAVTFATIYYFILYWTIAGAALAFELHRDAQARRIAFTRERLEVLRAKLNPHFLFNTLNAISTMSLQRDHEAVVQSLALVADLLRVSLDDSLPQEIPLRRELELTDKYLAVQRLRFGERLQVERDVDPRAIESLVPSMLLQPIVENAIVHGVGAVPGAGLVRISARAEDRALRIVVRDSGPGFSGERAGIGLANTRERLAALYGDAASLEITNDRGAVVTVVIPK
jgi:two-component system, LytTR family, sensor kinase